MALARPAYRPRDEERGVLHTVVRAHLETFLREAARRAILESLGCPPRRPRPPRPEQTRALSSPTASPHRAL